MSPYIETGFRLLIEPISPFRMKPGDIIAIKKEKGLIIHRLISKYEKGGQLFFREKGDCNLTASTISAGDISGRVIRIKSSSGEMNLKQPNWELANTILALYGRFVFFLYRSLRKPGQKKAVERGRLKALGTKAFSILTKCIINGTICLTRIYSIGISFLRNLKVATTR